MGSRVIRVTVGVLVLFAILLAAPAQDLRPPPVQYVPPKGYVCYRATTPVKIDGRLDKPVWQAAPWSDSFVDIEGDAKPRPRFRTRVKMLWDDNYFYIGAELEEPHVWATLTEHDSVIFNDNDFEVFIDPNGDNHEYYEFEINALGTGWDLLLEDAECIDHGVDMVIAKPVQIHVLTAALRQVIHEPAPFQRSSGVLR